MKKRRTQVQRCQDELIKSYGEWLDQEIWRPYLERRRRETGEEVPRLP